MREVNERVFDVRGASTFCEYVCECALRACTASVRLSIDEYLAVREDPTWFVVAPGHSSSGLGRVVRSTDRYEVVEKLGGPARVLVARAAHEHERRTGQG